MILIPFVGAFSSAIICLMEKLILKVRKVKIQTIHVYSFLASLITMLPLIYFFWHVDSAAFQLKNILIFASIIIASICANLLAFYAVKWEKLTNVEPAKMLEPLFVILLAIVFSFFSSLYTRDYHIIIPALIAGIALVFSHLRKHHLDFNRFFLAAIGASFLFAIELILSRMILEHFNPISFYFFRNLFVLFFSWIIFRPSLKGTPNKIKKEIFFVGFLWVIFRISVYYGYLYVGVVETTLILLLAPVLVYFLAWKFLKEKLDWKNLTSAAIILGCVAYVVLK